ncbi:MAG: hydantoinase/oxoprolinase family protein, partial [Dehalococcoidia bacterium]|nr:hydantoinase/oxoprolinase family protein [Dehalococcoidia bacterium]
MFLIGIDIGGTFTDLALVDESGYLKIYKSETTPEDLSKGVMNVIALASRDFGMSVKDILQKTVFFAHGTTAATNAFLQRKGCRTGLITTFGFGDTILISRLLGMTADMPEEEVLHYSCLFYPEPIVPYRLIKEVRERVDYKGSIVVPLEENDVLKAAEELKEAGVEAVAVCLLWSFKNQEHEQRIKSLLNKVMPGIPVTLSSELIPVAGEYERTAAVVINSYLSPIISNYLKNLSRQFEDLGLKCPALIMTSAGGVLPVKEAGEKAVSLLESGPAGGIIASTYLGQALGHKNIIATDMGGTSFDAGLIIDNQPVMTHRSVVGKYHINIPMIDISSIGTGGGSIARVDGAYLRVGPYSAGAVPGPVCYGKGGTEPTVTDADVVLGYIDPDFFLGGRIKLDKEAAAAAIKEKIAGPLGISVVEAAAGIRRVSDSQMADLLRKVTLQRGHDPREFVLFAYGGAGPTHCASFG